VRRALAYPLAVGTEVRLQGRVKECANLVTPGRRLLDVGCSSGWLSEHVIRKGFVEYIGMDRAIVGSQDAKGSTRFVEGSVFGLPFLDGSFDSVCMFDVIEHLPRGCEERALREIWRVLESGGKLYFSTPHASPVHTPFDPVWYLGHRHYRRATVHRLLRTAGFNVDRLFVAGGLVECLNHIRLLTYKHVIRRPLPQITIVDHLIERSHSHDRRFGMTLFAVASR
jgi:SAM-dependent methyltransferase